MYSKTPKHNFLSCIRTQYTCTILHGHKHADITLTECGAHLAQWRTLEISEWDSKHHCSHQLHTFTLSLTQPLNFFTYLHYKLHSYLFTL